MCAYYITMAKRNSRQQRRKQRGGGALNFAELGGGNGQRQQDDVPDVLESGTEQRQPDVAGGNALAFSEFATVPVPVEAVGGSGAAQHAEYVYGKGDQQHAADGTNVIAMNKVGGRRRKRGGQGVLTDVAVPALLLYANTVYKPTRKIFKGRKSQKSRSRRRR
jgi:hypothetical protein